MSDIRKQAVSIRLGQSDIRKIKLLAERLGVRDSDVIRYALKSTLNRLAPLCDPQIRGRSLVPVLVEVGTEVIRQFELDADRLEELVNDGVEDSRRVARDDIALLALAGLQQPYALVRLGNANSRDDLPSLDTLRQYLYDKYVYEEAPSETASCVPHAPSVGAGDAVVKHANGVHANGALARAGVR